MPEAPLPGTVEELLALVDHQWGRLGAAIAALGEEAFTHPLGADGWSPRDVLGHARLYDAWLLGVLEPERREPQAPYRSYLTEPAELDERNRVHLERERGLDPARTRAAAAETHAALREALAGLAGDRLAVPHALRDGRFVPAGEGPTLAWLVAVETWWHYRDHAAQLEAASAR